MNGFVGQGKGKSNHHFFPKVFSKGTGMHLLMRELAAQATNDTNSATDRRGYVGSSQLIVSAGIIISSLS